MNLTELSHIEVSKIMQGNNKAVLLHANKRYLLSITRRGKLILTLAEDSTNKPTIEDVLIN
jgi:hypothetical protein